MEVQTGQEGGGRAASAPASPAPAAGGSPTGGATAPAGEAPPPSEQIPTSASAGGGEATSSGEAEDAGSADAADAADGDGVPGGGDDDDVDTAAEAAGEEAAPAAAQQKRDYVRWMPEEEAVFYGTLRDVAGQKPEMCLKEVTRRLDGSKDYAQVRHYYYRLIKRLNKILGSDARLDIKNPLQVHRAMIKFWEVLEKQGMKGTCMVGIMKKPRKSRELSNNVQRGVKAVMQRTAAAAAAAGAVGPAVSGAAKAGAAGKGGSKSAGAASSSAAGGSRKRKPRSAAAAQAATAVAALDDGADPAVAGAVEAPGQVAAAEVVQEQDDVVMADAEAPPTKQPRRTTGPSTRRQHQAMLEAAAAAAEARDCGDGDGNTAAHGGSDGPGCDPSQPEGSSQSQTGAHEGEVASQQPARSSLTAGSQPAEADRPACGGAGSSGGGAGCGGGGAGGSHSFRSSSGMGMSGAALEGSMGQAAGSKLRMQLMPLDSAIAASMAAAGYHPFLELTLSTSKSLQSVLRHLGSKWQQAVPAGSDSRGPGEVPAIFVHPPAECPITLRGMSWGGPDCDGQLKVGDIFSTLLCPSPFQLLYSWSRPAAAVQAAAPAAAPSRAGQLARPSSSRATSQQRQQHSARQDELAAVLKEAISAVAVGPVEEHPAAEAQAQGWEQQQQQQQQAVPAWDPPLAVQWTPQQAQQDPGGTASFMQLLSCEVVMPDGGAAGFVQQDAPAAGQRPAALAPPAFVPTPGAGFAPQDPPRLPTAHFDEQLPAGMETDHLAHALAAPAAGPPTAGRRRQPGKVQAAGEAAGDCTPVPLQAGSGSPPAAQVQTGQAEAEPPATDPRKPRGLLGLLQTPAEKAPPGTARTGTGSKAAKATKPKRQAQPRKTPASSKGGTVKGGGGQKKKGAAAAAAAAAAQQQQQFANLPLPAGFLWAHMHPHLQQQQPQQVPVQQEQPVLQQPALLLQDAPQPAQQPPLLQQPALGGPPSGGRGAAGALDFGNDTLLHFLDATAAGTTAAGFPANLSLLGSPKGGGQPADGAVASDDFSLKSWPSLSPPSNFQLPDGFDSGLSPLRKRGAGTTLAGGGAKAAGAAGVAGSLEAVMGPTDFSLLLANVASEGPGGNSAGDAAVKQPGPAAAPLGQACVQPRQVAQQQQQQPRTSAAAQQAGDALFGGASCGLSLFGFFGGPGATRQAGGGPRQRQPDGGAGSGLPLPGKEVVDSLAFDFGSLLGVGDAAPSWLGPGGAPHQRAQQGAQPQEAAAQQLAPLGDRPFAALFGK